MLWAVTWYAWYICVQNSSTSRWHSSECYWALSKCVSCTTRVHEVRHWFTSDWGAYVRPSKKILITIKVSHMYPCMYDMSCVMCIPCESTPNSGVPVLPFCTIILLRCCMKYSVSNLHRVWHPYATENWYWSTVPNSWSVLQVSPVGVCKSTTCPSTTGCMTFKHWVKG